MNNLSLSWDSLSVVASLLAGLNGKSHAAFCLVRNKGEKQYRVILNVENTFIDMFNLIENDPPTKKFLEELGFFASSEDLTNFVVEEIQLDKWNARYSSKNQWTQNSWRFIPAKFFSKFPQANHWYWQKSLERAISCPQDKWALDLHSLFQYPCSKKSLKEATEIMKSFSMKRQSWEQSSGQSLRFWAQDDQKWQDFMDKWDVSYRHTHDNVSLVIWALSNGWDRVISGWKKETSLSLDFVPSFSDIPSSWADEDEQNGSLWHWACAVAPSSIIQELLLDNDFNPNILNLNDQTALHWACMRGRADIVRFLCENTTIDLNQEDVSGHLASEFLSEEHDELFSWMEDLRLKRKNCSLEKQK